MKKAKIMALILVVSLMLTGAAYALWNQSITLTSSNATGEMDVSFVGDSDVYALSAMPGIHNDVLWWYETSSPGMSSYMELSPGSIATDGQSIEVTVGDLYPGAKYGINFTIRNTGTVPIKLAETTILFTSDGDGLSNEMKGGFQFVYKPVECNCYDTVISVDSTDFSSLEDAIVDACSELVLYPGDELASYGSTRDTVNTFMQVSVDDDITGDDLENSSATFEISFNWQQCQPEQYNDDWE